MPSSPRASRLRRIAACTAVAAALATSANAAIFTVGAGAGCTHSTVPLALLAAFLNGPTTVDTIRIANDQSYTSQAITIDNQSVILIGGFPTCADPTPSGVFTNLSGVGGFAAPVVAISNSTSPRKTVLLANLDIVGGEASGVTISGDLAAFFEKARLAQNDGVNGGGVSVNGTAGALVSFDATSLIKQNDATNGGGLYCSGAATVVIQSEVHDNNATADGGGVHLANGCALIANSTDARELFRQNDAGSSSGHGGAIFAASGATALLYGGANNPIRVTGNSAYEGGGFYLTGNGTAVELSEVAVRLNVARPGGRGGAVAVGNGADLLVHRTTHLCAANEKCNLFELNGTSQSAGTRDHGGVFWVFGGGSAVIRQAYFTNNLASDHGTIGYIEGSDSLLHLEGSMLRLNTTPTQFSEFYIEDNGLARLAFTTTNANLTDLAHRMFKYVAPARVEVYSSIFSESTGSIFDGLPAGITYEIDCVLSRETASFPPGATEITAFSDPTTVFANHAFGDLHLAAGSPAIDACDTFVYTPLGKDIDDEARGYQDPFVPDNLGTYDLGADERLGAPAADVIFTDGFESGDLSAWAP